MTQKNWLISLAQSDLGVGPTVAARRLADSRRMTVKHIRSTIKLRPLLLALVLLGGCAVVPVQEMSDARQAIQAAREAGAEERSPGEFERAQRLLEQAQKALELGEYKRAREDALSAKQQALQARERALDNQSR